MVQPDDIQLLFDYSYAATDCILDVAGRLSIDQWTGEPPFNGIPSLRHILVHMLDVEQSWREALRAGGHGTAPDLDPTAFPDAAALAYAWRADAEHMRSWLSTLDHTDLKATAYTGRPLWLHLIHILNHDTQHRGEAAMLLTHWGQSPGDLDLPHVLNRSDDSREMTSTADA